MGIPSYYKRLVDRFPKLVQKGIIELKSDVLLMDFNCLIYQCIRSPSLPPYTAATRDEWERALIEAVKIYTTKVWNTAGHPSITLIAVDGVVPMAKIRQQRLRRFKSRWMAAAENEAGVRKPGEEVWDTNAITPGTEFMEKLAVALHGLGSARGWIISTASEPGEGEQKIMTWVRANTKQLTGKSVAVYGLDADLIVLSLLSIARDVPTVKSWKLLRELAEFEGARAGETFGALDICELLKILVPSGMTAAEYLLEYACGMSFLGNDFLPHSLSVKMREGGHDLLCQTLVDIHTQGKRLLDAQGKVNMAGVSALVNRWSEKEEEWIGENFTHKFKMRSPPPRNERERLMSGLERLPIEWNAESLIWNQETGFIPNWQNQYKKSWLHGASNKQVVSEYLRGLQWIVDYYIGKPVSYTWYYPWNVPPLWNSIKEEIQTRDTGIVAPEPSPPVAPQEQLAMVLPLDSWYLVRDPKLRSLPSLAPVYWPAKFTFFSTGRRWFWECESEIPIFTAGRLHSLMAAI